jgi:ubiquinone/menaquinone biosynthesis C-methylase UbiE
MNAPIYNTGAIGYDEFFGQITQLYIPSLLRAARLRLGQSVLDVATGTGAAAKAALAVVGPVGSVVGGDVSPQMLALARHQLASVAVTLGQFDAHDLPFADCSFDAVVCQLGLMFFTDPMRALLEFRRVLRPGGWVAVSVNSTSDRSLFLRVGTVIAEYVPAKAEMFTRAFSIRTADRLQQLFERAGFQNISVSSETREVGYASFEDYFSGIERGATISGQEYVRLPDAIRQKVRADVRRGLKISDGDGPFTIVMELLIGSAQTETT